MSYPSLVKTWQHNVNNAIAAQGSAVATNRRILRSIKNALVGFATNPWTVRYSCNGTVAGAAGDGVDRWTTDADINFQSTSGSARSWIVLRQPGTGMQIVIDLYTANPTTAGNGSAMTCWVSHTAGFTGGSTTARPTATDEQVLVNTAAWTGQTTDVAARYSVQHASDGSCTIVWGVSGGTITYCWLFNKPANTVTGWTTPATAFMTNTAPTVTLLSGYNHRIKIGSTLGNAAFGTESASTTIMPNDASAGAIANEVDGNWPIMPMNLVSNTVGIRGRHGTPVDMWYGSPNVATGDTYDSANFVQIGVLILPWNGGAVNLT